MNCFPAAAQRLQQQPVCGYQWRAAPAAEPTALAALALLAIEQPQAALPALRWLTRCRQPTGAVAPRPQWNAPHWPTGLAAVAWNRGRALDRRFADFAQQACLASLQIQGEGIAEPPAGQAVGHDLSLIAWPWAAGTHSWVEPTCMHMLGLHAADMTQHPRMREAELLVRDRQLPQGGWNYGNTVVLGQVLRPHLQPTGLALLALRPFIDAPDPVQHSLTWAAQSVQRRCGLASLAWAVLGLRAYGQAPANADQLLQAAWGHRPATPLKDALAVLAKCPTGWRLVLDPQKL